MPSSPFPSRRMTPSDRAQAISAPWRRTLTLLLAVSALAVTGASPAAAASPADVADDIPNFTTPGLVAQGGAFAGTFSSRVVAVAARGYYGGSVEVSRRTGTDNYGPFVNLGRLRPIGSPEPTAFTNTILGDPAAVQTTAGIEVFVRGTDNRLYTNTLTPSDQAVGYSAVPGGLLASSDPEVVQLQTEPIGNIRLFVRGTDGAVWSNIRRAGSWEGWTSLGGSITSEISVNIPLAAAFFPGSRGLTQLVARGADKRVYVATITGQNVTWEVVGGNFRATSNITFAAGAPLSVLYARGEDGRAWTIDRRVAGAQWTPIDGQVLTRGSEVAATGISIFVIGGARIYTNRLDGSGYTELTGDAPGGRLVPGGNPVAFAFKNPNETAGQTLLFKETDSLLAKTTQPGPGLPFNRFDFFVGALLD